MGKKQKEKRFIFQVSEVVLLGCGNIKRFLKLLKIYLLSRIRKNNLEETPLEESLLRREIFVLITHDIIWGYIVPYDVTFIVHSSMRYFLVLSEKIPRKCQKCNISKQDKFSTISSCLLVSITKLINEKDF